MSHLAGLLNHVAGPETPRLVGLGQGQSVFISSKLSLDADAAMGGEDAHFVNHCFIFFNAEPHGAQVSLIGPYS